MHYTVRHAHDNEKIVVGSIDALCELWSSYYMDMANEIITERIRFACHLRHVRMLDKEL